MTAPACSVVLPVYNGGTRLAGCLESLTQQSMGDFELVAIDDGSTDDSADQLREWSRRDPRVRVLSPGRVGLVAALNTGLAAARAPFVARMDADDRMAPERLSAQLEFLEAHPEVVLCGAQVRITGGAAGGYREYARWQNRLVSPPSIAREIFVESPIAHPSMMFRRERVLALGGYREGDFPEDYELLLRLHAAGEVLGKVPRVLLDWHDGAGRTSRRDPRYRRRAFDRLRARYLAADERVSAARRRVVWGAGKSRRRTALLRAAGIDFEAWIDIDPRKVDRRLWERPVHPPEWLEQNRPDLVLVYVSSRGAREQIAAFLDQAGYGHGSDYLLIG